LEKLQQSLDKAPPLQDDAKLKNNLTEYLKELEEDLQSEHAQMEKIQNKLHANEEQLEKTQNEEKDFYGIPILSDGVRIRAHQTLQKSKKKALEELVEKIDYIYIMNERLIDPPKNQTMDGKEKGVTTHEISRKTIGDLLRDSLSENDKQAMDVADEAYKGAKQAETEERLASAQGDQKWKEAREKKAVAYEKLVAAERELRDLYKSLLVNELYSKGEQFHPIIEDLQEKKAKAEKILLKEIGEKKLNIETIVSKGEARQKLIWTQIQQNDLQERYAHGLAEMNNCYKKYDEELERCKKAKELSDKIKDLTEEREELTCAREAKQKQFQLAKERLAKGASHSFEETSPTSLRQGASVLDSPMDQSRDGEMIPAEIEKAEEALKQKKAISVAMDKASQKLRKLKYLREEVEIPNSILKEPSNSEIQKSHQVEKSMIEMEKEVPLVKEQLKSVNNEIMQIENNLEKENMQREELRRTIQTVQKQCNLLERKRIEIEKDNLSQFKGKGDEQINEQINELVLLQENIKKLECEKEDSDATLDKFFEQKNALFQALGQAIETSQDLPRMLPTDIEALKNSYSIYKNKFIEGKNKICEEDAEKAKKSMKKVNYDINKYEKDVEKLQKIIRKNQDEKELLLSKYDSLLKAGNDDSSNKVKLRGIEKKREYVEKCLWENFQQRDSYDQACGPKLVERSRLNEQISKSIKKYEAAIAPGLVFRHLAEGLCESNKKEYSEKKDIILKEIIDKENEKKENKNNLQLKANSIGREIAEKKKELLLKQKQKRSLEEKLHAIHLEKEQLAKEIEDQEKELCDHIKRHERDRKQSEARTMEPKKSITDLTRERTVQLYSSILPDTEVARVSPTSARMKGQETVTPETPRGVQAAQDVPREQASPFAPGEQEDDPQRSAGASTKGPRRRKPRKSKR
jgi:hypothetical protein